MSDCYSKWTRPWLSWRIDILRFAPVDVTDESSVRAALDITESELGPITSAVNCAGIGSVGLTFSKRGLVYRTYCMKL